MEEFWCYRSSKLKHLLENYNTDILLIYYQSCSGHLHLLTHSKYKLYYVK